MLLKKFSFFKKIPLYISSYIFGHHIFLAHSSHTNKNISNDNMLTLMPSSTKTTQLSMNDKNSTFQLKHLSMRISKKKIKKKMMTIHEGFCHQVKKLDSDLGFHQESLPISLIHSYGFLKRTGQPSGFKQHNEKFYMIQYIWTAYPNDA